MTKRTEIAEQIPWVSRLDESTQCIGFKNGTPLKAIYNWGPGKSNPPVGLEKYRCRNPAWWYFEALGPVDEWDFVADTGTYCWSHLVSRALHGTYRETLRFQKWLSENGYIDD